MEPILGASLCGLSTVAGMPINWLITEGWCSGLHFHDLRHTGNHLAAQSKVSTRDLMNRIGHDSMRAALIYQHVAHDV
jgi:integrase